MLNIVLDTNVFVSATISDKGFPGKILDLWRKDKFEIILTPEIVEELWQVFTRPILKKHIQRSDTKVQDLLIELQEGANSIIPTRNV